MSIQLSSGVIKKQNAHTEISNQQPQYNTIHISSSSIASTLKSSAECSLKDLRIVRQTSDIQSFRKRLPDVCEILTKKLNKHSEEIYFDAFTFCHILIYATDLRKISDEVTLNAKPAKFSAINGI